VTQFDFLEKEFAEIFEHAKTAELSALSDPRGACARGRLALEIMVKWLYDHDGSLSTPYNDTLSALIHEPSFRQLLGRDRITKAKIIKDYGNRAAHDHSNVPRANAVTVVRELFHLSYWLVRTYAKSEKPDAGIAFNPDKLEQTLTIKASTAKQIKAMQGEFAKTQDALKEEREARLKSEEAVAELKAQIAALQAATAETKAVNTAVPDRHDYTEAETRKDFIDLLLNEAGWKLDNERDREFPLSGLPTTSGKGNADYVLWGKDGKPLAVVEAKRTSRDKIEGRQQAKNYADALERQFGQRPVIICTNGYEHEIWDDEFYPPRDIQGFLKRDELELLHQRRSTRKKLASVSINEDIAGRPYQTRAIRRVGETFEKDRMREALLVMATGSGKTRTTIALIDQLMRANWVRRVLFLADRRALVRQAHNAFKAHIPATTSANLLKSSGSYNNHDNARICLSTYATMMNLIDKMEDGERHYGPGHFDLIIIDEAHRSVYKKYKAIFEYFDSLLIGLTATPKDEVDRDTYKLFELETGVPTDSHDLEDAVKDGFLVLPKPISVPLKFQRDGITYYDLSDEEKDEWDALEWSDDGPPPDHIDSAALNDWLFNKDTVDKVLKHLMEYGIKVDQGERLGKTIIFAKNSKHAEYIYQRFNKNYPHYQGKFARVIDYKSESNDTLIENFENPHSNPHIAISVDMLDTGIDVPSVVNLVFFKVIRSKTKFWQMIGRGTRLCLDLFGVGKDKTHFQVFDYCQNFEFFLENPDVKDGKTQTSLSERLFKSRVDLISELDAYRDDPDYDQFASALKDQLCNEVQGMNPDNFVVRAKRQYVEPFQVRDAWDAIGMQAKSELKDHVAGLPTSVTDEDTDAKGFDQLIYTTQLAMLTGSKRFSGLKDRIVQTAQELQQPNLRNIPVVKTEKLHIDRVTNEQFWENVTVLSLETIRTHLRALIKLIEPYRRKTLQTNFEDQIEAGEEVQLPELSIGLDKASFLMKARRFVREHEDHIALIKLRRNEALTTQDLEELERIFVEQGVADSEAINNVNEDGGLGLFVRTLVGLEREAAKSAMATFASGKNLSANQLEFVDLIVDYLTQNGVMEPKRLYESPFTDLDDQGVSGVFSDTEVVEIVALLKEIKKRTAA